MEKAKQVGWQIWTIYNPNHKRFDTEALTAQDKERGYRSRPVYINEDDLDEYD